MSTALGSSDPRGRRNSDEAQNSKSRYGSSLTFDKNDRLIVKPGRGIPVTTTGATAFVEDINETSDEAHERLVEEHNSLVTAHTQLESAYNLLLLELKRAGFIGG